MITLRIWEWGRSVSTTQHLTRDEAFQELERQEKQAGMRLTYRVDETPRPASPIQERCGHGTAGCIRPVPHFDC